MIDPLTVLIATPAYDGRVEAGYAGSLAACGSAHLFGNICFLNNVSDISLARDALADGFLKSPYEWLVFIDSDTVFDERDFRLLCEYPLRNGEICEPINAEIDVAATRDIHGHCLISCAEYARKNDTQESVRLGLGFCRIARRVFEILSESRDGDGVSRIHQFFHKGQLVSNYFQSGIVNDGHRLGEDTGFFSICRLAGIVPRIEQRCNLVHWGRKGYNYVR
jgi:hypothetical protein